MTAFNCPFAVQRPSLTSMVPYEVTPPFTCSSVTISNRTTGDLTVYTDPAMTNYFIISTCCEERIDLPQVGPDVRTYRAGSINFILVAADSGDVVLLWT